MSELINCLLLPSPSVLVTLTACLHKVASSELPFGKIDCFTSAFIVATLTDRNDPSRCSGGGVGGLTLAVALSECPSIEVDIYEAASKFAEIGAGIGMWPRTSKIMEDLGLADDLATIATRPPSNEPSKCYHLVSSIACPVSAPDHALFYDRLRARRLPRHHSRIVLLLPKRR